MAPNPSDSQEMGDGGKPILICVIFDYAFPLFLMLSGVVIFVCSFFTKLPALGIVVIGGVMMLALIAGYGGLNEAVAEWRIYKQQG